MGRGFCQRFPFLYVLSSLGLLSIFQHNPHIAFLLNAIDMHSRYSTGDQILFLCVFQYSGVRKDVGVSVGRPQNTFTLKRIKERDKELQHEKLPPRCLQE